MFIKKNAQYCHKTIKKDMNVLELTFAAIISLVYFISFNLEKH